MQKGFSSRVTISPFFVLWEWQKGGKLTSHNPESCKVASHCYKIKGYVPEFNQKVAAFHPLSLCFGYQFSRTDHKEKNIF